MSAVGAEDLFELGQLLQRGEDFAVVAHDRDECAFGGAVEVGVGSVEVGVGEVVEVAGVG